LAIKVPPDDLQYRRAAEDKKVILKKGCVARAGKEKHTTKEEDLPAPASFIVCV